MPQERIDNLLELVCEGVTDGALKLKADVLVRYARCQIKVLGRPGGWRVARASAMPR